MVELKKICELGINLKVIAFFNENPSTVDTSRGIATWLNHERKEVKRALDYLVEQQILVPHRIGSSIAYSYTQDRRIVEQIKKFLAKRIKEARDV